MGASVRLSQRIPNAVRVDGRSEGRSETQSECRVRCSRRALPLLGAPGGQSVGAGEVRPPVTSRQRRVLPRDISCGSSEGSTDGSTGHERSSATWPAGFLELRSTCAHMRPALTSYQAGSGQGRGPGAQLRELLGLSSRKDDDLLSVSRKRQPAPNRGVRLASPGAQGQLPRGGAGAAQLSRPPPTCQSRGGSGGDGVACGPSGKAPQSRWPELPAQSSSRRTTEGVPAATATPTGIVKSLQLCPRGHRSPSRKQLRTRTVVAPQSHAGHDTGSCTQTWPRGSEGWISSSGAHATQPCHPPTVRNVEGRKQGQNFHRFSVLLAPGDH